MSVNEVNKQTGDTSRIAGGTLYADAPIGAILAFGGTAAPAGWLLCQGQAVSRTTYAALFAAIGTAYGAGDGSTTFNLPDPREAALVGAGTNVLNAGSIAAHNAVSLGAFQDDQMQKMEGDIGNVFNFTTPSGVFKLDSASPTGFVGGGEYNPYNVQMDTSKAARTGTTTHGKQLGVNYIIKAEQVALPLDIQSEVDKKLDKFYLDKSGLDLDDCTEAGLYEINILVANMPTGADGGNMLVSQNPTSGAIVQTYFATNGTIASRYKLDSAASWTSWLDPFTNRPALQYAKNVQYTSDASGNIVLANSIDNVVIVSVRVRGNATWTMGYNPLAGYYIHLMDYTGQVLASTTVNLDIVYYSYDWTAA